MEIDGINEAYEDKIKVKAKPIKQKKQKTMEESESDDGSIESDEDKNSKIVEFRPDILAKYDRLGIDISDLYKLGLLDN